LAAAALDQRWTSDSDHPDTRKRELAAVGVLDMGWEKYKVAVEYDGDHHRTNRRQYAKDQWRLRKFEAMGWIIIRVIAEDEPQDVVRRVRDALARRGCRDT
jgi:very-short-patch-repair endonuclease